MRPEIGLRTLQILTIHQIVPLKKGGSCLSFYRGRNKHEDIKNLQQGHTDQESEVANLSAKTVSLVVTFYKFL